MTQELPLEDAQQFLRLLWRLNHAIEASSQQMSARLGVTFQQRTILRLIGRFPGITASMLADTLCVDRGTISAALRRLEQRGLVVRRRDSRDGRRACLGLTKAGRLLDAPTPNTVESAVAETLQKASPTAVRGARSVLGRLIGMLERPRANQF